MQAIMLAAGMGKRLQKYTKDNTKCMVEVAGQKLIDRAVRAVELAGIRKFVLVIGYRGENLKNYILERYCDSPIEFVFVDNKDYATSNNIYSLYLAKDYLIGDDTVLLESDLIYEEDLIRRLVEYPHKDVVTVAKYESWMDGTVVTCDDRDNVVQFIEKADMNFGLLDSYFKTVNVYKFSKEFSKRYYLPFMEAYMRAYGLNSYYETVLKVISNVAGTKLKAMYMNDAVWYEIDDAQDLDIANVLFEHGAQKYADIVSKFGGYWRYHKILDFCYLVNPYFPPKAMVDKLQTEFPVLLTQYPSGLKMQSLNAERIFGVEQSRILVGNGAAELIHALGLYAKGDVAVALPTFNEYVRCFRNCSLHAIDNSAWDYRHNLARLKEAATSNDYLMLVNPDNPSGAMLGLGELEELLSVAQAHDCRVVIDESFVDFADADRRFTLLSDAALDRFPNLIVVKSVSKSFGVPGLRLGVLATADAALLTELTALMQIWNVNSFAEYYLQIYNLFAKDYENACDRIAAERARMTAKLKEFSKIKVYPSQANYLMIDLGERGSYDFCVGMLERHNILVKDLSSKNYFTGKNFVRVAVRDARDNDAFMAAFAEEATK